MYATLLPMASKTGLSFVNTAWSPPTMTTSVPLWAPHTPPETGASSTATPRSANRAWMARIMVGEPVERSA